MTDPHNHDFWRTPAGILQCRCGSPVRPNPKEPHMTERLYPLQDLTPAEEARIAAHGLDTREEL